MRDRRTVVAARAHGGDVEVRRRREGNESGGGGVKREEKQGPAARARDIYDGWARDFP